MTDFRGSAPTQASITPFDEFFKRATGREPYDYQSRLADEGLPPVLQVPTGAGKTAVILSWLWRRLEHPQLDVRAGTPRRLVFAVPMRSLAEQVKGQAQAWVNNLGLTAEVDVRLVMGGQFAGQNEWRVGMDRPLILVGTVDAIVSKMLMRAFGSSRASYPLDFALMTNGSHIVMDEVQLAPRAAATLRQIEAFSRLWPTAEPFGLTCMSATVVPEAIDTLDNPWPQGSVSVGLSDADRRGPLAVRLEGTRQIGRLDVEPGDPKALAAAILREHRPGTRTLVILNTVDFAVKTYQALTKHETPAPVHLLHSRFRPGDRQRHLAEAFPELPPSDQPMPEGIVIATQVVEAGIDATSTTLITETAPWASLCQRAGRCNRDGQAAEARMLWLPSKNHPYAAEDLTACEDQLRAWEGRRVTVTDLRAAQVSQTPPSIYVLRRNDFLDLFDTAPSLSGDDPDVSMYIRDGDDLDVYFAWVQMTEGALRSKSVLPSFEERCAVPRRVAQEVARDRVVWTFDVDQGRWRHRRGGDRFVPGLVYLLEPAQGGYRPDIGVDPSATASVPPIPVSDDGVTDPTRDEADSDAQSLGSGWVPLGVHLLDVEREAELLIASISPRLSAELAGAIVAAARWHDLGKAFPAWQQALRGTTPGQPGGDQGLWAKSPGGGRLSFGDRPGLRHELVSALLLDSHPQLIGDPSVDHDLVRYLVASHHGRVRIRAARPGQVELTTEPRRFLGLAVDAPLDVSPNLRVTGCEITQTTLDVGEFSLGGERSWTRAALALLRRFGPFQLAYAECLVRVADWRASASPSEVMASHPSSSTEVAS